MRAEDIHLEQIAFDRQAYRTIQEFPWNTFKSMHMRSSVDQMRMRIINEVTAEFVAEFSKHVTVREHRSWPSTWWDAFKERWFPKWALARWPVRYDRIDIDIHEPVYMICPHISEGHHGSHIMFMQNKNAVPRYNTLVPVGHKCCGLDLYVSVEADRQYLADRVRQRLRQILEDRNSVFTFSTEAAGRDTEGSDSVADTRQEARGEAGGAEAPAE